MRKKYNYFINGEMVPRKEFMDRLKNRLPESSEKGLVR